MPISFDLTPEQRELQGLASKFAREEMTPGPRSATEPDGSPKRSTAGPGNLA